MPFIPLFIVIGIFLAISKILQPSQHQQFQRQSPKRAYDDFEDNSLSLALIDYISRESKSKTNSNYGQKSGFTSGKSNIKTISRR